MRIIRCRPAPPSGSTRRAAAAMAIRCGAIRSACLRTCARAMCRRRRRKNITVWWSRWWLGHGPLITRRPWSGARAFIGTGRARTPMAETTNPVKRAGVIGLGAMGLQMARHLVAKGFEVAGYDIKAEANALAKSHGVGLCGSVAELGSRADVASVVVQTDEPVGEVGLGGGLLDRVPPGGGPFL